MSIPSQLNHYRILHPLGKGGMGEVFAAEDTRLHRTVALKVLPAIMAADPERRQRFEREAQAVAAINHPNIVTIHSVEEADGVPFLTMELIQGKPLNDVIGKSGLPLETLLRIGIAISDAVAAAHERGITHRDLKPGNVMVTGDGRVKVLDFGLAKLREDHLRSTADDLTRMPSSGLTGEGKIIGTVAYMSPEQAEGKPVDQRSDIFSLGVLLHEMATGEKPFKGDTNVSMISAILKDQPSSITDLRPELPEGLSRVVRRSLAKDPSRRYQTATDLRNELEELKQESDSGMTISMAGRPAARRGRRMMPLALAAAALIAAAALGYWYWGTARGGRAPATFESDRFTRITTGGTAFLAAISPDGRYVVHVKTVGTVPSLWVRQTSTTSDVQIVDPAEVRYDGLTFSPDGDYVYYSTYSLTGGVGTLYRVPVLGGTPQRVLEDVDSRISFSPDGKQFTFTRGAPSRGVSFVMVANADGTAARELASLSGADQFLLYGPAWSPDGATILAPAQSLGGGPLNFVAAIDAASGSLTRLEGRWVFLGDIVWMPDGHSFAVPAAEFGSTGPQIWQVSYPSAERRRVTNDLNNYLGLSVAADGRSLVTVQAENVSNIWIADASDIAGGRQITSGRRADGITGLRWTPDGRLVFGSLASNKPSIWIMNADGSAERQLTGDDDISTLPDVTPDGRFVVFQRVTESGVNIWRVGVDGSDLRQLTTGTADLGPQAGDGFVYYTSSLGGSPRTWKVAIDGGQPVSLGDHYFRVLDVSGDGRRLLGMSWDEKERRSVISVMPSEGAPPQVIPGLPPAATVWAPDDRSVTLIGPRDGLTHIFQFTPGDAAPTILAKFDRGVLLFGGAWSRDGKRVALARGTATTDVVLITAKAAPKN